VVTLPRLAQIASRAKVKNEILNREKKIAKSGLYLRTCVMRRTSPPAKGWLHAHEDVVDGTFRLSIREKDVALGFRECLHAFLKLAVGSVEVHIESYALGRLTLRFSGGATAPSAATGC